MSPALRDPLAVVTFWRAAGYSRWYRKSELFDALVRLRLGPAHEAAAAGLLDAWAGDPTGALGLVILLDQAPRNLFRGSARAFANDAAARRLARHVLASGFDRRVPWPMRQFFYLPFMHSEDLGDQELCVQLYQGSPNPESLKYAIIHRDIIAEYGRFPHRNGVLGRQTTAEEQAFLDSGGFAG